MFETPKKDKRRTKSHLSRNDVRNLTEQQDAAVEELQAERSKKKVSLMMCTPHDRFYRCILNPIDEYIYFMMLTYIKDN